MFNIYIFLLPHFILALFGFITIAYKVKHPMYNNPPQLVIKLRA